MEKKDLTLAEAQTLDILRHNCPKVVTYENIYMYTTGRDMSRAARKRRLQKAKVASVIYALRKKGYEIETRTGKGYIFHEPKKDV